MENRLWLELCWLLNMLEEEGWSSSSVRCKRDGSMYITWGAAFEVIYVPEHPSISVRWTRAPGNTNVFAHYAGGRWEISPARHATRKDIRNLFGIRRAS